MKIYSQGSDPTNFYGFSTLKKKIFRKFGSGEEWPKVKNESFYDQTKTKILKVLKSSKLKEATGPPAHP